MGTPSQTIPNLDMEFLGGLPHADDDVYYATLDTLARRLGRNMAVHRHDRFFQVHYVQDGKVRVLMDDCLYQLQAPMFFVTPPAFAHAFVTQENANGHVLTVRQQVVAGLLENNASLQPAPQPTPICLAVPALQQRHEDTALDLNQLFAQIRDEFFSQRAARAQALLLWTQLLFISLFRMSAVSTQALPAYRDELRIFHQFQQLMETHFMAHWSVPAYTRALDVGELRLNEVCRRVSGKSPKQLVHARMVQEAKRLLGFTSLPVSEVAYALGFKDPAYFSRFFQRHVDTAPGQYRAQVMRPVSAHTSNHQG